LPTDISNLCVPLGSNSLQILVTYLIQHANRLDKHGLLVRKLRFVVIVVCGFVGSDIMYLRYLPRR